MKYIPLIELAILAMMISVKAIVVRRKGKKAVAFGDTHPSDFLLLPLALCFIYAMLSGFFDLPFPVVLRKAFWQSNLLYWLANLICTASLIWLGITLKSFGQSFRVGIDEQTRDQLITTGTFAISRNPVFVAFIVFFLGLFLAYPNMITLALLVFSMIMIHRQILREENFLKSHYGKEYEGYCSRIRRYI